MTLTTTASVITYTGDGVTQLFPVPFYWLADADLKVYQTPGAAGVVQEAGAPRIPSISTRHMRQEPKASSESVAQSLGIFTPRLRDAAITDVPLGTVTNSPSMVRVTVSDAMRIGVP